MYLGRLPVHARSVPLVLDLSKGYVSLQFHCTHDKAFATVRSVRNIEHRQWKVRAGFVRRRETNRGFKGKPQSLPDAKDGGEAIPETLNTVGTDGSRPEVPEMRAL